MPAILIGFGIIACIHDAFRDPEYLPLDDHELNGFGLFSFISGTGSMTFANIPGVPPDVSEVLVNDAELVKALCSGCYIGILIDQCSYSNECTDHRRILFGGPDGRELGGGRIDESYRIDGNDVYLTTEVVKPSPAASMDSLLPIAVATTRATKINLSKGLRGRPPERN
nr:PRA1 family protein B3-like [Ipomoea batatas]